MRRANRDKEERAPWQHRDSVLQEELSGGRDVEAGVHPNGPRGKRRGVARKFGEISMVRCSWPSLDREWLRVSGGVAEASIPLADTVTIAIVECQ